jgi:hypothetical protein
MPRIYPNLRLILIIYMLEINTENEDLKKIVEKECIKKKEEIRILAHQTIDNLFVSNNKGEDVEKKDQNEELEERKEDFYNTVSDTSEIKKEKQSSIFLEFFINLLLISFVILSFSIIVYFYYKIIEGLGLILENN